MKQKPATGRKNYQYLTSVWQQENMCTFKDFLRCYNNKDVVPTLESMRRMVDFYHNEGTDMLKLGYTLPKHANICLHKSTTAKFYPFTESNKDLFEKICEDMVCGPSIVFPRRLLWTRLLFGIGQTCAKLKSKLMLDSYILSLCVKQCQLVCKRDGN